MDGGAAAWWGAAVAGGWAAVVVRNPNVVDAREADGLVSFYARHRSVRGALGRCARAADVLEGGGRGGGGGERGADAALRAGLREVRRRCCGEGGGGGRGKRGRKVAARRAQAVAVALHRDLLGAFEEVAGLPVWGGGGVEGGGVDLGREVPSEAHRRRVLREVNALLPRLEAVGDRLGAGGGGTWAAYARSVGVGRGGGVLKCAAGRAGGGEGGDGGWRCFLCASRNAQAPAVCGVCGAERCAEVPEALVRAGKAPWERVRKALAEEGDGEVAALAGALQGVALGRGEAAGEAWAAPQVGWPVAGGETRAKPAVVAADGDGALPAAPRPRDGVGGCASDADQQDLWGEPLFPLAFAEHGDAAGSGEEKQASPVRVHGKAYMPTRPVAVPCDPGDESPVSQSQSQSQSPAAGVKASSLRALAAASDAANGGVGSATLESLAAVSAMVGDGGAAHGERGRRARAGAGGGRYAMF